MSFLIRDDSPELNDPIYKLFPVAYQKPKRMFTVTGNREEAQYLWKIMGLQNGFDDYVYVGKFMISASKRPGDRVVYYGTWRDRKDLDIVHHILRRFGFTSDDVWIAQDSSYSGEPIDLNDLRRQGKIL